MDRTYPSRQLPVELIFLVLDALDLTQLVQASHICRTWRAVALDHPLFWRVIRLSASSTSALDFFQARLDHAGNRQTCVDIHLEDCSLHGRVRSVVLPAVARSLSRIVRLGLFVHHAVSPGVVEILSRPAPVLEQLLVACFHCPDDEDLTMIPTGLLAGSAPQLWRAAMKDFSLPCNRIHAFCTVEEFTYTICRPSLFPTSIFEHCPRMRELMYLATSCPAVEWSSFPQRKIAAPSLETLEVQLTFPDFGCIFDAMPDLASLRSIGCRQPDAERTRQFLEHLDGPLEMEILSNDQIFVRLNFISPSSVRQRTFVHHQKYILSDWERDVMFDLQYTQRIRTLRVSTQMEWICEHIPSLPACHTLHLSLDKFGPARADGDYRVWHACLLPSLKTVVVAPTSRTEVSAYSLQGLVMRIAGPRSSRLQLRLNDGAQLVGESSILERDFEFS